MVAAVVTTMVSAAVAMLANTLQTANAHSQNAFALAQQARICLQRMERTIQRAYANELFPGVISFSNLTGGFALPDTLVIWTPINGVPANSSGLPQVGELTIYTPSATTASQLLEITLPSDSSMVPDPGDDDAWQALLASLRSSNLATRRTLIDRLRTGMVAGQTRAALRLETRLRPDQAALDDYRSLPFNSRDYSRWRGLDWPQGLYSMTSGIRQVWCRIELQLVPENELPTSDAAVPFFGSAAFYYTVSQ